MECAFPLAATIQRHMPDVGRGLLPADDALNAILATAHETARSKWPTAEAPVEVWLAAVAGRLAEAHDHGQALASLWLADIYLACACMGGTEQAARTFDNYLVPPVRRTLRKMRVGDFEGDDMVAQLRLDWLYPSRDGGLPGICRYSGRGPLQGWVRSAAIHAALKARRKAISGESPGLECDVTVPLAHSNPELRYLKAVCLREFKDAFAAAMATLTPLERNLLRQRYLDGVGVDALAALRQTHRATVARHLAAIREKLLERARAALAERLPLDGVTLESVIRSLRQESGFDLSVERLLRLSVANGR